MPILFVGYLLCLRLTSKASAMLIIGFIHRSSGEGGCYFIHDVAGPVLTKVGIKIES